MTVIEEATKAVNESTARKMIQDLQNAGVSYIDFKTYSHEGTKSSESNDDCQNNY